METFRGQEVSLGRGRWPHKFGQPQFNSSLSRETSKNLYYANVHLDSTRGCLLLMQHSRPLTTVGGQYNEPANTETSSKRRNITSPCLGRGGQGFRVGWGEGWKHTHTLLPQGTPIHCYPKGQSHCAVELGLLVGEWKERKQMIKVGKPCCW